MATPKSTGSRRAYPRRILDGIIFRMPAGCQRNRLPRELEDDSTIHRTFQRCVELGILQRIGAVFVEECVDLRGVEREWQAACCAMSKTRFEGIQ